MSRFVKVPKPAVARLFSDSDRAIPTSGVYIANIDGASRGNPGPSAYAVVIRDPAGHVVLELAKRMGRETNNVAEYYALLAALDYATSQGIGALRIRSDSELLVRQMQGRYRVKSADLKPLYERAGKLARQLAYFAIEHVPREQNGDADRLANVALDSGHIPSVSGAGPGKEIPARRRSVFSRRIRARFEQGVFTPLEPLDLPEGSDVVVDIHIPPRE
jgi:ribonuclease HI